MSTDRRILGFLVLAFCGVLLAWVQDVAADTTLKSPSPTPVVLDRDGAYITQVGHLSPGAHVEYGFWRVSPPPRVVAATLALEDRRFWYHPGVDPIAILRAALSRFTGGTVSGASTIAMQVARMQHPRPRNLWAKAIEAGVAVAITARYGRDEVLAQYLRLAPYGESSHGIGHAAWWYFGRPAADLDFAQAALLAGIPQSPARLALRRQNPRSASRAQIALLHLADAGVPGAAMAALQLASTRPLPAPRRPPWTALVLRLQARARDLPARDVPLLHASIDLRLQTQLSADLAKQLREWRNFRAQQAALMVLQRESGAVLACMGSVPGQPGAGIDFSATDRSPGSALKPFFYALALDRQMSAPDEILLDTPDQVFGIGNADHAFLGPMLPRQALANSRNVPATALLRRVGLETGFAFLHDLGLHDRDGPAYRFGLGMAIGAVPTRLDRLVRAYAALADDGAWRELRWFDEQPASEPRQLISVPTARLITRFLSDPMARLPSFPRYGSSEYPLAVALKTGTSQGYRDAWALAWSDRYLVGAWVGRPDGTPMGQVSGASSAAHLVQGVLLGLHGLGRSDLVAGDFAAPPGHSAAEICADTGHPGACANRQPEFLTAQPASRLAAPADSALHLAIVTPPTDTHFWRNPELPASLDRLVLRASTDPSVTQVTWLVDGVPATTATPEKPFLWPMLPGHHRFQLRLPLTAGQSSPITVDID